MCLQTRPTAEKGGEGERGRIHECSPFFATPPLRDSSTHTSAADLRRYTCQMAGNTLTTFLPPPLMMMMSHCIGWVREPAKSPMRYSKVGGSHACMMTMTPPKPSLTLLQSTANPNRDLLARLECPVGCVRHATKTCEFTDEESKTQLQC